MESLSKFDISEIDQKFGCTQQEIECLLTEIAKCKLKSFQWVAENNNEFPYNKYIASCGSIPDSKDNEYNAWSCKCILRGAESGLLCGKTLTIKDNTSVAGVSMFNGSKLLEGFIPKNHATVVNRVLDAGGRILGKAANVDMCLSGASFPIASGAVRNPYNQLHSAGGSSSGCAALIACGSVDMAIGGDQGGSIRMPASSCGIVGLKPTFGLVPYTGAIPILTCIDHLGPMARTVEDCAILLQVRNSSRREFKIAVLQEGFELCTPEIQMICRRAIDRMAQSRNFPIVKNVTVAMHKNASKIFAAIAMPGVANQMVDGQGFGTGSYGLLDPEISDVMREGFSHRPDDLSIVVKYSTMLGKYTTSKYGYSNYAKAQCLALELRKEYDRVLDEYDVIVMPTVPTPPVKIPDCDASVREILDKCLHVNVNTCPLNITHHPAINIPAGFTHEGLPIGLQFVGKHFKDDQLLAVAAVAQNLLSLDISYQ